MKKESLIINFFVNGQKDKNAFSLIEIILSVAIFALIITAVSGFYLYGQESSLTYGQRLRALSIAQEGIEATRNIRNDDFDDLIDGSYGLIINGSGIWEFNGTEDLTDIFTRQIIISSTDDENIKNIVSNVTWTSANGKSNLITLTTELANWVYTTITEIIGDWTKPSKESSTNIDVDYSLAKIFVSGSYAYIINNYADSKNFIILNLDDLSHNIYDLTGTQNNIFIYNNIVYIASDLIQIINISNPIEPITKDPYNTGGKIESIFIKDNILYVLNADKLTLLDLSKDPEKPIFLSEYGIIAGSNIYVSGDYAYIASKEDGRELQVIDVSDPTKPQLINEFDLPDAPNIPLIAISGNTAIMAQGSMLFAINIKPLPENPPEIIGQVNLTEQINDIALYFANSGLYCFVVTGGKNPFSVVDINSGEELQTWSLNIPENAEPMLGVYYDETLDRAFTIGRIKDEKFIIIQPEE